MGGLDPVTFAVRSHNVSVHAIAILTAAIKNNSILTLDIVSSAPHCDAVSRDTRYNRLFDSLLEEFDGFRQHSILHAKIRISFSLHG